MRCEISAENIEGPINPVLHWRLQLEQWVYILYWCMLYWDVFTCQQSILNWYKLVDYTK